MHSTNVLELKPGTVAAQLPLAELESQLLGMAGHLAAAQCRFLDFLAEFDRRDGWAGPGLRSCAHWLSWRIGMSLRTAVEQLRVAHALEELPAIRQAFSCGRVYYSKVRAITRIARPATEEELLLLAMAGTTSHVERVVRAARQQAADPVQTNAQRSLTWHWDDDGMLVLRGRLAPAEGAAVVAAIEACIEVPSHRRSGDSDRSGRGQPHDRGQPPDHRQPHDRGHQQPGNDRPSGDDERSEGDPAELRSAEAVDPVAARRADALHSLAIGGASRSRTRVVLHFDDRTATAGLDDGPALPARTAERMACDAEVQLLLRDRGSRLYLGRSHRLASPAQIAALCMRDGRCCQWVGCTHTLHLHAHHVRHWLHGGRTDIGNLLLLCSFHHSRVHDHGYRIVADSSGGFRFLRPDSSDIPSTGAPLRGDPEELVRVHDLNGPRIDPEGLTPSWGGERLDLTPILQYLLAREPSAAGAAA